METKDLAVLALVFSFLIPLVGIILGIVALVKISNSGGEGKGPAVAAIIVSLFVVPLGLTLIGALAYYGALDPGNLLPERCDFQAGMLCESWTMDIYENNIQFDIENQMGQGIMLYTMTLKGTGELKGLTCSKVFSDERWEGKHGRHMGNGESTHITLDCSGASLSEFEGNKKKFDIDLEWYKDDSNHLYAHINNGGLLTKVGP
ncbi:MAG: DUF4190 domain-containing protein [bacterium]|nr:DUF4190 domain-containing protein [bacterium]